MRVLNAAQMREADRRTIGDIGIPSLVLMENAGRQAVAAMEAMYGDLPERQVAVLCGRGNNGGDGFVVARTLAQRGVDVSVFLMGRVADVRGDARTNLEILGRLGLTVVEVADSQAWELRNLRYGSQCAPLRPDRVRRGGRQCIGNPGGGDRFAVRPFRGLGGADRPVD